jgi:ubiquinone/menaquinone biosynthesis C-methylase UbiE
MIMTDYPEYFEYLKTRSVLGQIYRNYWLYPRLSRLLRGRVLDVGCGIGDMLIFRPGTVGADVNPHTVNWNRQRGLDVSLIVDGKLPFSDQSFDGCVMDNVLEHIADPTELLAEVYRVLLPGAAFVVGVPGKKGFASDADHKVYYDKSALCERMTKAGFLAEKSFWMPMSWTWLDARLSQYCLYGVFRVPHKP